MPSSPFLILLCPAPYSPELTPDLLGPTSGDIWQALDSGRNLWERGGQRKGEARALLSPLPFCLREHSRSGCFCSTQACWCPDPGPWEHRHFPLSLQPKGGHGFLPLSLGHLSFPRLVLSSFTAEQPRPGVESPLC